ncbi:unnamed protein product [Rangifer tarandus platyrhynchus]|uniref:Uncharacterized protein n=1 Tax=Rangifer tarandus platyrhynchus TaxID=3082113 RepID=A0AC59YC94_RANTA
MCCHRQVILLYWEKMSRDLLGGPEAGTLLPLQGVQVPSLVGELKPHKLHSAAKKKSRCRRMYVMFIAVQKRTEEFVRKHIHTYIHICTYMYAYAYIHMFVNAQMCLE